MTRLRSLQRESEKLEEIREDLRAEEGELTSLRRLRDLEHQRLWKGLLVLAAGLVAIFVLFQLIPEGTTGLPLRVMLGLATFVFVTACVLHLFSHIRRLKTVSLSLRHLDLFL